MLVKDTGAQAPLRDLADSRPRPLRRSVPGPSAPKCFAAGRRAWFQPDTGLWETCRRCVAQGLPSTGWAEFRSGQAGSDDGGCREQGRRKGGGGFRAA